MHNQAKIIYSEKTIKIWQNLPILFEITEVQSSLKK